MFEQKSDKKLMTTVVLGWRRAAERGRMERRQGDEMAAAAAAAAAVEEQQMAVKERMARAKYAAHCRRNSAQFCEQFSDTPPPSTGSRRTCSACAPPLS